MRLATLLAAFAIASGNAADELPHKQTGEAMDFEPGLLPDLSAALDPADSTAKIESALARAKKSAASGERMFRAGIIAKVEAEKRALKVIRLESDLARARLESAKLESAAKRVDFETGKLSQEQLAAAEAITHAAATAAELAAAAWQRAELAAAELNLKRQRQLLAAGIGSKTLVARAQSQVAGLKNKSTGIAR